MMDTVPSESALNQTGGEKKEEEEEENKKEREERNSRCQQ